MRIVKQKSKKNVPQHTPTISVALSVTGNTNRSLTSSGRTPGVAHLQNDMNKIVGIIGV